MGVPEHNGSETVRVQILQNKYKVKQMTTTYSASELKVGEDWRYSEPQMKLRQEALIILMKEFGNDNPYTDYPNRAIYECANEWVEKGHATTSGLVSYFKAYYTTK